MNLKVEILPHLIQKEIISHGVVYNACAEIWNSDLDRKYSADFEVYGQKAQNSANAEVDIFIAIS